MAVVRFSDELKSSILTNAKAVFETRISKLRAAVPKVGDEIAALVYAPLMPTINSAPREFFVWRNWLEVARIGSTTYNFTYELVQYYPTPQNKITTPEAEITSNYSISVRLADAPVFAHIKQQFDDYVAGLKALEAQRDEFVSGVKKLIEAHSTLAPALKAWPPLWDLVSETYRERHRKVVERSKPEASEIDVDLTKLTATVAVHKLVK